MWHLLLGRRASGPGGGICPFCVPHLLFFAKPATLKSALTPSTRISSGLWCARFTVAGDEEPGEWGAGERLAHQAGQEQDRAAWPVVHHDVLGLPGGVALDRDHNGGGLALDRSGVLLDEAVVAVVAGEAELLALIDLAGRQHDGADGLRPLRHAL